MVTTSRGELGSNSHAPNVHRRLASSPSSFSLGDLGLASGRISQRSLFPVVCDWISARSLRRFVAIGPYGTASHPYGRGPAFDSARRTAAAAPTRTSGMDCAQRCRSGSVLVPLARAGTLSDSSGVLLAGRDGRSDRLAYPRSF